MNFALEFHHIGVACRDIAQTAAAYEVLGYRRGETIFDPIQHVNICFLTSETMPCVELLEPVDAHSPVLQTIEKNGTTPYHVCYAVDNLDETLKILRRQRYIVAVKPQIACAIGGRRVAFLYKPEMGLVELVEKQKI